MTTEQIQIKVAEVAHDEYVLELVRNNPHPNLMDGVRALCKAQGRLYTESYDAIIPVIQRQSNIVRLETTIQLRILWQKSGKAVPTIDNLEGWMLWLLMSTPLQLCTALLKALGKFED